MLRRDLHLTALEHLSRVSKPLPPLGPQENLVQSALRYLIQHATPAAPRNPTQPTTTVPRFTPWWPASSSVPTPVQADDDPGSDFPAAAPEAMESLQSATELAEAIARSGTEALLSLAEDLRLYDSASDDELAEHSDSDAEPSDRMGDLNRPLEDIGELDPGMNSMLTTKLDY